MSPLVDSRMISNCLDPFLREQKQTDVFFKECFLNDLDHRLEQQQIDMVIRPQVTESTIQSKVKRNILHSEPLYYLPKQVDITDQPDTSPISIKEISNQTFVLTIDGCGLTDVITSLFEQQNLKLKTYPGQALSYQTLIDWTDLGIGSAILPASRIGTNNIFRAKPLMCSADMPAIIHYESYWLAHATYPNQIKALHSYFKNLVPNILTGLAST